MRTKLKTDAIWGFSDQALQSLINLLSGVFLIRYASKEEYGLYGLGFAVTLLCVGICNALVMTQMTVIAPSKEPELRNTYCGSMFIALMVLLVSFGLVVLMILLGLSDILSAQYMKLICVLVLSVPGVVAIEYVRRYFYLKLSPRRVFSMDLVFAMFFFTILAGLYIVKPNQLHLWVLLANGVSAFMVAGFVAIWVAKLPSSKALSLMLESINEAWQHGLWALGGVLATALQNQGYIFLLAAFKGVTSIAEVNAARLLLSPVGVLSSGLARVFMPRMAYLNVDVGIVHTVKLGTKVLVLLLLCILIYGAILLYGLDWVVGLLMTSEYHGLEGLVALWVLYYIVQSIRSIASQILQVLRKFHLITISVATTALLWFSVSLAVINYFGVNVIIITMIAAELLLAVVLWKIVWDARKTNAY